MSRENNFSAEISELRTEIKYLKWIIPSGCGFVALLVLILFGIEHSKIGERVEEAFEQKGVEDSIQITEDAAKKAKRLAHDIETKKGEVISNAQEIVVIKNQASQTVTKINQIINEAIDKRSRQIEQKVSMPFCKMVKHDNGKNCNAPYRYVMALGSVHVGGAGYIFADGTQDVDLCCL